jgi:MOSC domain-containing protein YiiM
MMNLIRVIEGECLKLEGRSDMGRVMAICLSERKGTAKARVEQARFIENFGIEGDAHAGNWHRQVSLLSYKTIQDFAKSGADIEDGAFGENMIVQGIPLAELAVKTRLKCGEVLLQVTQIGKECHSRCHIYYSVGDCIMPRAGIFARVIKGGSIRVGDEVKIVEEE